MKARGGGPSELVRQLGAAILGAACFALAFALAATISAMRPLEAPADSPPGAAPSTDHLKGIDDVVPIASYTLSAKLDANTHAVTASGEIRFKNASSRAVDHLFLHLYMNAFEHERTVFRRKSGSGMRGEDVVETSGSIVVESLSWKEQGTGDIFPHDAHTPNDVDDRTDILVPLPRAIEPNEEAIFEVRFRTNLPSVALRAGYSDSFHMVAQWFPKLAKLEPDGTWAHFPYERFSEFYSNYGDYDVTIDVPSTFDVGATGSLASDERIGERRVLRFTQRAVGDFAFAAWDGFAEATRQADGVAIRCLFPRGQDRAASIELEAAARGLAYYGDKFGPYPYDQLTIVHPPSGAGEAGGMEYPTLITTGGGPWQALVPARVLEVLTLHELAHQWFYGIVGTNENASPFLDEGLTSYATERALVATYGEDSLVDVLPFPVSLAELERASQLGSYDRAPVATRAGGFESGSDYARLVYSRAATILRTLDGAFDDAGLRSLGAYARTNRFAHPNLSNLVDAIREQGGDEAAAFAEQAFSTRASADFVVTSIENQRDGDAYRRDVTIERRGTLEVPVTVELVDEAGVETRVQWDGRGASTTLTTRGGSPVRTVLVDPERRILVDESRSNDALSLTPHAFAPRTLVLSSFAAALMLHAVAP